mmetsp:Transcript_3977/g.9527  ORF Transcript_3977/g.9527 Transcript_3977/m.9527 type:complete len:237 (+) Transcript_3977:2018-2728(+)
MVLDPARRPSESEGAAVHPVVAVNGDEAEAVVRSVAEEGVRRGADGLIVVWQGKDERRGRGRRLQREGGLVGTEANARRPNSPCLVGERHHPRPWRLVRGHERHGRGAEPPRGDDPEGAGERLPRRGRRLLGALSRRLQLDQVAVAQAEEDEQRAAAPIKGRVAAPGDAVQRAVLSRPCAHARLPERRRRRGRAEGEGAEVHEPGAGAGRLVREGDELHGVPVSPADNNAIADGGS